jgi:CRP/FNR family cyclic AMP-dependent transcriptional regulator
VSGGASTTGELLTIERVSALHRAPLFAEVPGHALVAVARLLEEVHVESGTTFLARGALEDWLYVVAAGSVRVHVGDRTLGVLGAGAVVGELAVLAPAPRAASATAVEPSLLLRLRQGPFEELLEDRPEIARAVIHTLARLLQAADHGVDAVEA